MEGIKGGESLYVALLLTDMMTTTSFFPDECITMICHLLLWLYAFSSFLFYFARVASSLRKRHSLISF